MRLPLAFALAVLALVSSAAAQDGWRAYPAFNEVTAVASAPDGVWAGTSAGVFFYGVPDGEIATYTPVGALRGGPLGALAYDAGRGALWVGYEDGLLERLDAETGDVASFFDLTRADQYAARGVRQIRVAGDVLYLATDFGVVVFDAAAGRVLSTYDRIGTLGAGTPVNDVVEAPRPDGGPGLWVAAEGGAFYADRTGPNLQAPGAWARADGFEGEALSLALLDGALYAGGGPAGARDLYRATASGPWERLLFVDNPVGDLAADGGRLLAVSPAFLYVVQPGLPTRRYAAPEVTALRAVAVGPEGGAWAGDAALGLFRVPLAEGDGIVAYEPQRVLPPGPFTNNITGIDVGRGGVLWASTARLAAANTAAVSRLEGGVWTDYLTRDPALDIARTDFRAASVGPDGAFYAGAEGDGLTVFTEDGVPTTYREGNSSLLAATGAPGYLVVPDVAFEGDRRWVLNQFTPRPLHLFAADGAWAGLPYPAGIPSSAFPVRLAVDQSGYKWLALGGSGLAVWDTGADPADPRDDRAVRYTPATSDLPAPTVTDVAVDGRGRVWVGTERGVATVAFPDAAFGGDPGLSRLVIADGADFFLRDVAVNDLEVDPSGRVWIATTSGAFLVNEAGNDVAREVTAAASPLPSDDVLAIAVDPRSGRVFMTTAEGLFSVAGDATLPVPNSDGLRASPNPFRPAQSADGVLVTGLAGATSDVRVMTVAGDVVWAGEVSGGAFRWDGRDQRTGRPAPSGVYLVAAAAEDGETVYGKVAVIR
ncbi:two-component regulator propeller domain-containing protein [Rubrivirga sp. S365]|uniref:Two-component regulator propeller domain-containing protein n=1 Tax=Rubrivirga litoralis TaxID=3075598 RepID=A0ABU3BN83_9BACT|nr:MULTISPECIES: two-component regulator propeller domain-containing protein [unclassified Rubrivirga]MDT0630742.1 two-component regulator propeller domain-containing protein [Rubrivirga sp. F394]MDT7856412.1 two-component regulator propeller domain-containing protein [Rubrivirga sp. S365]